MPTPRQNPHRPQDYAQEVLWIAIASQVAFLAGSYWKVKLFTSGPFFWAPIVAPVGIVLLASSWRRALRLSFLSSLIIPIGISLVMLLAALISIFLNPTMDRVLKQMSVLGTTSLLVWMVVLTRALPAIAIGCLIRWAWERLRSKPRT